MLWFLGAFCKIGFCGTSQPTNPRKNRRYRVLNKKKERIFKKIHALLAIRHSKKLINRFFLPWRRRLSIVRSVGRSPRKCTSPPYINRVIIGTGLSFLAMTTTRKGSKLSTRDMLRTCDCQCRFSLLSPTCVVTDIDHSTVKSQFNEKSRFKVWNLVTKMKFLIKKSRFSVKSQFKEW